MSKKNKTKLNQPPQPMRIQLTLSQQLQRLLPTLPPDLQTLTRRALKTENALITVADSMKGAIGTLGMAVDYLGALEASILEIINKQQEDQRQEQENLRKIEKKMEEKRKPNGS